MPFAKGCAIFLSQDCQRAVVNAVFDCVAVANGCAVNAFLSCTGQSADAGAAVFDCVAVANGRAVNPFSAICQIETNEDCGSCCSAAAAAAAAKECYLGCGPSCA